MKIRSGWFTKVVYSCEQEEGYRFGFNTQEKVNEVSGVGNHYTAPYWEYDPRTGRRWNLDPITTPFESPYLVNGDNPIYYNDPLGDYKTKFGAQLANFFHGGTGVAQNTNAESSRNGEWYYNKKISSGGSGEEATIRPSTHYGKEGGGAVDKAAYKVAKFIDNPSQSLHNAWNSPFARAIVSDYYSIGMTWNMNAGTGMGGEKTLTFILRGQDPGLYWSKSLSGQFTTSFGVDGGISAASGNYLRDIRNFSSGTLSGQSYGVSGGIALKAVAGGSISGGFDRGVDDKNNTTTLGKRVGISIGLGGSTPVTGTFNTTQTSPLIRLIKF